MILVYIFAETIRSNFEYFAFISNTGLAPPLALFFFRILKLTIAAIYLFRQDFFLFNIPRNDVQHIPETKAHGL
jgi:hypothetical protein